MTRKPFRLAAAAVSGLAITTLAFGAPAAFADTAVAFLSGSWEQQ